MGTDDIFRQHSVVEKMAVWYATSIFTGNRWMENNTSSIMACFFAYVKAYPIYKHHRDESDSVEAKEAREKSLSLIEKELASLYYYNQENENTNYIKFRDATQAVFQELKDKPNISWLDFKENQFSEEDFLTCAKFVGNIIDTFDVAKFAKNGIKEALAKTFISATMTITNLSRGVDDAPNTLDELIKVVSAMH